MSSKNFIPVKNLTIYKNEDYGSSDKFYIEIADIIKNENGFLIGAGKPLKIETMEHIAKTFALNETKQITFKSIIPETILYAKSDFNRFMVIWYYKPQRTNLCFTEKLNIPDGRASVPGLIFQASNYSFSVYAVKKLNGLKTEIYRAPFHNVDNDGRVCLGNVKIKDDFKYFEDIMETYQKAFWQSRFSETHGTPVKGNINLLWKGLIQKRKPFPLNDLLPKKIKLGYLINH